VLNSRLGGIIDLITTYLTDLSLVKLEVWPARRQSDHTSTNEHWITIITAALQRRHTFENRHERMRSVQPQSNKRVVATNVISSTKRSKRARLRKTRVETNWKDEQTAACKSLRNMARPEGFESHPQVRRKIRRGIGWSNKEPPL
jgi:hypothetical protein